MCKALTIGSMCARLCENVIIRIIFFEVETNSQNSQIQDHKNGTTILWWAY